MKTVSFLCSVIAISAAAAPVEIGMRVEAPSTRGYTVDSIRQSGERGGTLLTVGDNFTAEHNREMGEAMELWNAHRWGEVLRTFLRSYFLRNWRRKNAGFLASAVVKIAAIVPFEQATIWWIAVLGWFSDRTRNLAELKSYAEFGS